MNAAPGSYHFPMRTQHMTYKDSLDIPLRMDRRHLLLLATAVVFSGMTSRSNAETTRPNIILCMADDQGWGDVGYYGKSVAKTPVLDEMAASGLRFDRFYAAAPVCSPTRGSVMTGRNPNRFACFSWGHSLRPEEVTIAEVLNEAGYATGHFGKWHLGSVDSRSDVSPGASGFDRWFSAPNFFDNDPLMSDNGRVVQTKGESSEVTVKAAIEFVRACTAKNQIFFAVVWFGSPHNPHRALDKDRALYADQPEKIQHYYGEITGIDRSMGVLRDELRRLGIMENTLVWYTSDNGPQGPKNRGIPGSSGGLRDRKATLWEGGIRVPTIIEWPTRVRKHRITSVACNTVDIFPTLLDIVGVDIEKDKQPPLDGISILPLIDDKMTRRSKPMGFWSYRSPGTGMNSSRILEELRRAQSGGQIAPLHNDKATRDARASAAAKALSSRAYVGHAAWIDNQYKLHRMIDRGTDGVSYELYDLNVDAAESRNLASEMPTRVATMKRQLEEWQQSVVRSLEGKDYVAVARRRPPDKISIGNRR